MKIDSKIIKQLFVTGGNDLTKVDTSVSKIPGQQNFDAQSALLGKSERIYNAIKQSKQCVVLISRYISEDQANAGKYMRYLVKCMQNANLRGEEAHCGSLFQYLIYKQNVAIERDRGLISDISFLNAIGHLVVYIDYGISPAMYAMINTAKYKNYRIEYRKIGMV